MKNWIFDPTKFGFTTTLDPWIYKSIIPNDINKTLIAEKNTVGSWIIKLEMVDGEFNVNDVIYHGKIPTRDFAIQLIANTDLIDLLYS